MSRCDCQDSWCGYDTGTPPTSPDDLVAAAVADRADLEAENERLKAEVKGLRRALRIARHNLDTERAQ